MKKLFLTLALVATSCFSNAQTVGDHINDIKAAKAGVFGTTGLRETPYTYTVENFDAQAQIVYIFNTDLVCTQVAIYSNPNYLHIWIKSFNNKWANVGQNYWQQYLDDGNVLYCKLQLVEDVGLVFFIGREEN